MRIAAQRMLGRRRRRRQQLFISTSAFFVSSSLLCTLRGTRGLSHQNRHASSSSIPIFFDSTNSWHRDNAYHPEQPERITACLQALHRHFQSPSSSSSSSSSSESDEKIHLIDIANIQEALPIPDVDSTAISQEPFSEEALEHARQVLCETHESALVTKLEETSRKAKQHRLDQGRGLLGHMGRIDFDTYVTTETYNVCLRATCAWMRAIDLVTDSSNTMIPAAFCLTRPPGHHATYNESNGFCIYNFAAAAALHVLKQNPNANVSIVDWDVHYGQGTADIVQRHEGIRYVSIHQTNAFPYMGESNAIRGKYKNVCTIPMPADTTWTCGYEELWNQALDFCSKPGEWEPDVVIVSAGYDALSSDELASCSLTADDFGKMTKRLRAHLAATASTSRTAPPALVFGMEGGYQLRDAGSGGNLPQAVIATIQQLVSE